MGRGSTIQLGDVVVLDSGYTPAANGIPSPVVRTFVRSTREPNLCGCDECQGDRSAHWTEPTAAFAVRVTPKRLVESGADLGVFAVDPCSRRGLIARLRAEKRSPATLVGRAGLRTSSAGPTLSEVDQ